MARKRRGRGEGSIYQRADGTWCGSISSGYTANGKRRRHTAYGKTKKEVQDRLQELQREGPPNSSRLTVSEYLNRWLETTIKPSREPTTHQRYEQVVRLHIVPHIGRMKVSKLHPLHVEHLYAEQKKAGSSDRNRELSGVILQRSLKHAVRLGIITSNPCTDIAKPRPAKREMQVWNVEESECFLAEAKKDRLHALYVLAIATGARQGELFAMEWSDIDFEGRAVSVNKTLEELRGKLRVKHPKTAKSRRRIDLPQFAVDALHDHRKQMLAEGHATSPVFCATDGGWLRKSNFTRRSYKPILQRAEVPPIRFHDLRHTAATFLLLLGENPKIVSERLGHGSIEITLNTYSHVLPNMQKAAADKLDRLFG